MDKQNNFGTTVELGTQSSSFSDERVSALSMTIELEGKTMVIEGFSEEDVIRETNSIKSKNAFKTFLKAIFVDNWKLKLTALGLGAIVWLMTIFI